MIIIDGNGLIYTHVMSHGYSQPAVDEALTRHTALTAIKNFKKRFEAEYGKTVICFDSDSWRKDEDVFPEYKLNRKKAREKDEATSRKIKDTYDIIDKLYTEIRDELPWLTLKTEKAEADDIIATLVRNYPEQKHLIISSDKDFVQLHTPNVQQFSPRNGEFVDAEDAEPLFNHILKGDVADGIPNVLSDNDTFIAVGKKQTPLGKTKRQKYIDARIMDSNNIDETLFTPEEVERFNRNRVCIDLACIPENVKETIQNDFVNAVKAKQENHNYDIIGYLTKHDCVKLLEEINHF